MLFHTPQPRNFHPSSNKLSQQMSQCHSTLPQPLNFHPISINKDAHCRYSSMQQMLLGLTMWFSDSGVESVGVLPRTMSIKCMSLGYDFRKSCNQQQWSLKCTVTGMFAPIRQRGCLSFIYLSFSRMITSQQM